MKTSQRGLDDIIFSEGEVLHAYADELTGVAGNKYRDVLTIGVGHTSAAGPPAVTPGMTITHAESRDILSRDIRAVEDRVLKAFDGKAPPQTVFDGAVSFDFNTGGVLRATWPTLWMKGDMAGAEKFFMEWNKPPEIIGRRKREADLIFRGKYHSPAVTGQFPPPPDIPAPKPQGLPPKPSAAVPTVAGAVAAGTGMGALVDGAGGSHAWIWALAAAVLVVVAVEILKHWKGPLT